MVVFIGPETCPSSGDSCTTIIRKRVVLPAPFGPTSPARSPGLSWNEASTKTSCLPYCLEIRLKLIMSARQNAFGRVRISHGRRGRREWVGERARCHHSRRGSGSKRRRGREGLRPGRRTGGWPARAEGGGRAAGARRT